jgi:Glycosyl transferase family 2
MKIKNVIGKVFGRTEPNLSTFQIPPLRESGPPKFALTLATIVKNEVAILPEWIAFHLSVGFEHFYIYENGSTDGTVELLARYSEAGIVTVAAIRREISHSVIGLRSRAIFIRPRLQMDGLLRCRRVPFLP